MSRRFNLLPPYLAANPAWVQLVEAIDEVFEREIDLPTELLAKLRDNWILGAAGAAKIGDVQMLDSTDWFRFERETLIRQANQIGFLLKETDLLTDDEYQRLVRNLGAFWYNKGTPEFIGFIRFVLGSIIDIKKLFALPGPTYDQYGVMREEGDPQIGKLNYQFEETLTPLLPGNAETVANGGIWSLGPSIQRIGTTIGPSGLNDAVVYQSQANAGSSVLNPFPFENSTKYRLEVWLRRLNLNPPSLGIIGADTDLNGTPGAERVSLSVNTIPSIWTKYKLDFTTGAHAATAPNFLYALTDFAIGMNVAIAQPQLYKVVGTSTPGEWFETSHVHMVVDPMEYVPGSLEKMVALFNILANYHLVLNAVVFDMTAYIHPPGEAIASIVKAYPMIDIETTLYMKDPSPPTVSALSTPTAAEGGTLVFNVTLTNSSSVPFNLTYVRTGTAVRNVDFTGPVVSDNCVVTGTAANGTVQVPPGVSSFTITYQVLTDAISDPGETIVLTIGGVTSTGTIT
jgi:hypothetical protein